MAKKMGGFTIRESDLAKTLEISREKLDEIVTFFDADPDDRWELKENAHFIYLNKSLNERLFSEQGAYAIAKYIDATQPQNIWVRLKEFITKHREKIRNAFINQKIQENCSSLTLRNNRHFLSKKDVVSIFCTNHRRINIAFEEIRTSDSPLIKQNKGINITVHHIYDRHHYQHLADCEDNLITLSQEVHNDFHTWNGGYQKSCTADNLIEFVQQLHSDNYAVILRLNKIKQILAI